MTGPRIAIVGGGVSGLAAAWELRRRLGPEAHIQILEAYDRIGGKLKTVDSATVRWTWCRGLPDRRTGLAGVITELGLGDELRVPSGARSAFLVDGELVDIPAATMMGVPARGADVAEVAPEGVCGDRRRT